MVASAFALDIGTVKQIGVDRWHAEFSWPVSDQEFVSWSTAIEKHVRDAIVAHPDDVGAAFLIARELPVMVGQFLHARVVIDRVRAQGRVPMCSPDASWYAEMLGESPRAIWSPVHARSAWLAPAVWMARGGRAVAANANPKRCAAYLRGHRIAVYGMAVGVLREYLMRAPEWVAMCYDDAIPSARDLSDALCEKLAEAARAFVGSCMSIVPEATCDTVMRTRMERGAIDMLTDVAREHARMRAYLAHAPIAQLALTAATHHRQRALALAVRNCGGRVLTATHGGFTGLFSTPMPSWSEFAISDTYVTYTEGSAELCQRIHRTYPSIIPNVVEIVSGESQYYRQLRRMLVVEQAPQTIRTVMVIGFPQTASRKSTAAASLGLQQLDMELRAVDALQATGFRVLYKAHPDRIREIRGVFDDRVDVITEDFHTAHRLADAFFFGSMRTTAFPIALCTQKPIVAVLMDEEPATPFPDALALLARRVRLIRATLDDRARVVFGAQELRDAFMHHADPTDTAFFDQYLAVH